MATGYFEFSRAKQEGRNGNLVKARQPKRKEIIPGGDLPFGSFFSEEAVWLFI